MALSPFMLALIIYGVLTSVMTVALLIGLKVAPQARKPLLVGFIAIDTLLAMGLVATLLLR